MQSVMQTNMVSFLTAARKNRPNEERVPIPAHVVDSFLKELTEAEEKNNDAINVLTRSNEKLGQYVDRLEAKVKELEVPDEAKATAKELS